MSNLIFTDQLAFMRYFGQTPSKEAVALYRELVREECEDEMKEAYLAYMADYSNFGAPTAESATALADACIDTIYVTIGLLHAMGLQPQPLWDEVQRSNIDKIKHRCQACPDEPGWRIEGDGGVRVGCEACGGKGYLYEVRKREDGKVLKPEGWQPPQLLPLVQAMLSKGGPA